MNKKLSLLFSAFFWLFWALPVLAVGITNPFKGGDNLIDLISTLANFIFNLGVPVAVIIIIISGVRMLVSGGKPAQWQKGVDGLKYAILGLGVLLIGKGFVSLIKSFLGVITK